MYYNDYAISGIQMKAIKEVEKALKKAHKMGVSFWDNYGSLTAFNSNGIEQPVPDKNHGTPLNYNHVYSLKVKNFYPGNSDDDLYVKFKPVK